MMGQYQPSYLHVSHWPMVTPEAAIWHQTNVTSISLNRFHVYWNFPLHLNHPFI